MTNTPNCPKTGRSASACDSPDHRNCPDLRTVRIHVDTSVEIDVAAWELNYGDDLTENPGDARDYIENVIREQLRSVGVLAK